jgi:hypothetical protein
MSTWAAVAAFLAKYWRPLALVVIAAGLLYGAYDMGQDHKQAEWDLAESKRREQVQEVKIVQGEETVKVVTQYVDRVKIVKVKGDTIIKEIPKYVTVQDDSRCGRLGPGFVELWNAANENRLPDPARATHAGAGGPQEGKAEGRPAAE